MIRCLLEGDKHQNKVGTEFATASITSAGLEALFNDNSIFSSGLEQANKVLMDDVNYCKVSKRGFLKASFTKSYAKAEWNFVDTINKMDSNSYSDYIAEEF